MTDRLAKERTPSNDRQRVALCLYFPSPAPITRIAEACLRFTPKIAIRGAGGKAEESAIQGRDDSALFTGAIFLDLLVPVRLRPQPRPSPGFPPEAAIIPAIASLPGAVQAIATLAHQTVARAKAMAAISNPEESVGSVSARAKALCRRFGAEPRIASGRDPAMALARARLGRVSSIEPAYYSENPAEWARLPLEALQDYARPWDPDVDASRQTARMIELLQAMGLATVGDFLRLPERKLASRFGKEAILLAQRVRGSSQWTWPMFRPPERILEKIDLQDSETLGTCSSLESILFVLRASLDRMTARLRGRALRATRIRISLKLDREASRAADSFSRASLTRPLREWDLALPVPQGSSMGILPILRDRLAFDLDRQPLVRPATEIEIEVTETAPGQGAQRDFFNAREQEAESWDALVGRLSQKLGKSGAFVAEMVDRHFPEKAWKPVLQGSFGSVVRALEPDLAPPRPSRILKTPEPVRIESDESQPETLPMLVHLERRKKWVILQVHGPEKLAAEWWDPQSKDRDYYRVLTSTGEELWIFTQSNLDSNGFLHGYFD